MASFVHLCVAVTSAVSPWVPQVVGIQVALLGGAIAAPLTQQLVLKWAELYRGTGPWPRTEHWLAGWLTGLIERAVFFLLVTLGFGGNVVIAMVAWTALKMAANWGPKEMNKDQYPDPGAFRMAAALAGLVSGACAVAGGVLFRGESGAG